MKISVTSVCLALALTMGACNRHEPAHEAAADEGSVVHDAHESHADHAQGPAPVLPQGQKWPSDEPLRTAMSRIRAGVEPHAASHAGERFAEADAQSLARLVEENVAYMVENCKLEPQADAALHIVIGRMLNAAASLKEDPGSSAGVPQLVAALQEYGNTFDHSGWTALPSH